MFVLCLSLALLSSAYAFSGNRIVNGTDAQPGEIPYIISVRYGVGQYVEHICGGSIINEYWISTAAHCIYGWKKDNNYFSVQYGVTRISNDGHNTIPVEKAIYHPGFQYTSPYINDVGLMKLTQPMTFSELAQPVTLPPAFNATPGGAEAVLAGWGLLETGGDDSEDLQRVDINVFTDEDCELLHALTGPTSRRYHVCAGVVGGGKGQCNGDSGGPLLVNGVQVGSVSWSVKPCTIAPYPGVFAKTASYVEWINEVIAEDERMSESPVFVE